MATIYETNKGIKRYVCGQPDVMSAHWRKSKSLGLSSPFLHLFSTLITLSDSDMARSSALSGQQPSAEALYSPINPRLDVEDDRQGYRGEKINLNTGAHETSSRTDLYRISEWKWELFAWIIGTAIIASMVYILTRFHDKPLEEWPISIQISSAVAFLAQVAQAALL